MDETLSSQLLTYVFVSLVISTVLTGICVLAAQYWKWQTAENKRSLHQGNILVGGGCAIAIVTGLVWYLESKALDGIELAVLFCFLAIAFMSWIDDVRGVPISLRFLMQILMVTICLSLMPADDRVFSSSWPLPIDRILTGICWVWFINLFNFMDGIDGLATIESITICIGVLCVGSIIGIPFIWLIAAAALCGSSLGFLPWNWSPSKIILGDVGAISMGFLIGFLLIQLAVKQHLSAAFILPLYFLFDATITIVQRLIQGKKIWHAHREHFYQKAVLSGTKSSHIVLVVIATNVILVGLALFSINKPILGGVLSLILVSLLILHLHYRARH